MRTKYKSWLYVGAALLLTVLLCLGVYFFFDFVMNGTIVDWLDHNYMITAEEYIPDAGRTGYIHRPDWPRVKRLVLALGLTGAVLWGAAISACAILSGKHSAKKAIRDVSRMMRDYMLGEKDANDIFPSGYGEISAQMAEIKAAMARHDQIAKEEAARKNDLITYLAHDLKTPLTSVIGYLSLLDEVPDMPPEQRAKYVHITLDKACRLEKLVNEFFEITRYNLQQINLEKEQIDLCYMLVQMKDEFYPILSERGNTAVLCADENLTVYGDPAKLARVFNNILKNAAAYSTPNTEILIRAEQRENDVVVTIQNQGPTIPADKLSAIFEKFYRMDEARTSDTGGAGLGLAIAKEIVTLHGGTITAESHENTTAFTVTLPVLHQENLSPVLGFS